MVKGEVVVVVGVVVVVIREAIKHQYAEMVPRDNNRN
jgi:hypothetical protein